MAEVGGFPKMSFWEALGLLQNATVELKGLTRLNFLD
jgi:hypothetical protein